jgi:hypothetical protein
MHSNPKAIISQKATPIEATAQALQSAATGANEHGRTLRLSARNWQVNWTSPKRPPPLPFDQVATVARYDASLSVVIVSAGNGDA